MNAHAKRPRGELGPCPKCGLYSGQRLAIEGNPDMFLVACDACGASFDQPFIKISTEIIDWDGNREKHKKVVCPICFLPYFKEEADERTD